MMKSGLRMEEGRGAYEEQEVRSVGKQELGKAGNGHSECEEARCRGNQESRGNPEADTWGCEEAGCRGAKRQELAEVRKRILGMWESRNTRIWGNWTAEKLIMWHLGMWQWVCIYCNNHWVEFDFGRVTHISHGIVYLWNLDAFTGHVLDITNGVSQSTVPPVTNKTFATS